jgi:hypothetical protein
MKIRRDSFQNYEQMIAWTLSFMREGRALTFTNQVTHYLEKNGVVPYISWDTFWKELETQFIPTDEGEEAINTLETNKYFQGRKTVDDCISYENSHQVIMKF